MTYERIDAGQIQPGDRVARTRTRPFFEVKAVSHGPVAVTIAYTTGGRDRPRKTARWWREVHS